MNSDFKKIYSEENVFREILFNVRLGKRWLFFVVNPTNKLLKTIDVVVEKWIEMKLLCVFMRKALTIQMIIIPTYIIFIYFKSM